MEFDGKQLADWINSVLDSNLTYHVNRKNALDSLLKCKGRGFIISVREFYTLKSYLTMRSDKLKDADDAALAFQELIGRLFDRLVAEPEDEAMDDQHQGHGPSGGGSSDKKDKPKAKAKGMPDDDEPKEH